MNRFHVTRRRALATVIATALATAVGAAPATAAGPQFPIQFVNVTKNGIPVTVKKFEIFGAPVACDQGPSTYSTPKPLGSMKVKKNLTFSGTFTKNGTKVRITGKYKRSLQKVTGTLKISGKVGNSTGCTSGKLRWKTS